MDAKIALTEQNTIQMMGVYLQINCKMTCKNSQKHRNDRNWPFFVKNIQLGEHAYTLILQAKTREECRSYST